MNKVNSSLQIVAVFLSILAVTALSVVIVAASAASPMFGVTVVHRCQQQKLVVPALEARPLNGGSTVLGDSIMLRAHRTGAHRLLCATSLVRLA